MTGPRTKQPDPDGGSLFDRDFLLLCALLLLDALREEAHDFNRRRLP